MADETHADPMLAAFTKQVGWCHGLAAPFTAQIVQLLADDIAGGGPASILVANWPGDPIADALPIRFAGALHALVLRGDAPDLAACYPPHPTPDADALRDQLSPVLAAAAPFIRGFMASPPQTNEVGRSAVLLGGFLTIADATRLPLRLLEIGASAGLNLLWDRYHYRLGDAAWGDPASPVLLAPEWQGPLPPLAAPVAIAGRAGCDIQPLDLEDEPTRLRLRAYVWPDHSERLERLTAAIGVARAASSRPEQADAAEWVHHHLDKPAPGQTTILYHSVMWQYLPAATQASLRATLAQAGARATSAAPLAWLRFEPSSIEAPFDLRLTLWPGEIETRLALARPHGTAVTWLGPDSY